MERYFDIAFIGFFIYGLFIFSLSMYLLNTRVREVEFITTCSKYELFTFIPFQFDIYILIRFELGRHFFFVNI